MTAELRIYSYCGIDGEHLYVDVYDYDEDFPLVSVDGEPTAQNIDEWSEHLGFRSLADAVQAHRDAYAITSFFRIVKCPDWVLAPYPRASESTMLARNDLPETVELRIATPDGIFGLWFFDMYYGDCETPRGEKPGYYCKRGVSKTQRAIDWSYLLSLDLDSFALALHSHETGGQRMSFYMLSPRKDRDGRRVVGSEYSHTSRIPERNKLDTDV